MEAGIFCHQPPGMAFPDPGSLTGIKAPIKALAIFFKDILHFLERKFDTVVTALQ